MRSRGAAHTTMNEASKPFLLLVAPSEAHPFDAYLHEILLTEGYHCCEMRTISGGADAADLSDFALVLISGGAAGKMEPQPVLDYVAGGGRVVLIQPPRDWAPLLGLGAAGAYYSVARDAYLQVNREHPWLAGFPATDLQVPGEAHVHTTQQAAPLAFIAGQVGHPSPFAAAALLEHGAGAAVIFTYDLAEAVVRLHQGRPELSSTGCDPDANRDGKFTGDDAFEGQRDFSLRHVPQADVHQDLLVRAMRGLLADTMPLPRLWHFPGGAPALLFVDGDGDAMTWEDLQWVIANAEEFEAKYTLYLMSEQIEAFDPERVAQVRARGHEFGVHPWVGPQPDLQTWREGVAGIVKQFEAKFGYRPTSLRAHSCIFPGWDENPWILHEHGLRLDTSFAGGYRFVSGYLNGSTLPVRFISRDGQIIDCYEQSTVQTEDGSATTKCLLPPLSEDEALALARELLDDCRRRWHGVFHPYFHPINLSGRGAVTCQNWFRGVLQSAREKGMPSVNATEWLDFTEARRRVQVTDVQWHDPELRFSLESAVAIEGLTVLVPQRNGLLPASGLADGAPLPVTEYPYEGLHWYGVTLNLRAAEAVEVVIAYRCCSEM